MDERQLFDKAKEIKENAYAPYSKYRVGAALLTESGKLYTGVNIENASFGATCCAERTAIFKAVSEGEKNIKIIAIASDDSETVFPCGICRQVLSEFGDTDMKIICGKGDESFEVYTLMELLPKAFTSIKNK
jgi:cytidine deaminase